ncbi:MAG: hypothetical protein HYZ34_01115, partial [Ignavibacteriae bacterium]|nr:hypothetical protein [Ignavibacteriota bacterium]
MNTKLFTFIIILAMALIGCSKKQSTTNTMTQPNQGQERKYALERVGPARVVQ